LGAWRRGSVARLHQDWAEWPHITLKGTNASKIEEFLHFHVDSRGLNSPQFSSRVRRRLGGNRSHTAADFLESALAAPSDKAPDSIFKKRLWSQRDSSGTTRPHRPLPHFHSNRIGTEKLPKGPKNRRVVSNGSIRSTRRLFACPFREIRFQASTRCRAKKKCGILNCLTVGANWAEPWDWGTGGTCPLELVVEVAKTGWESVTLHVHDPFAVPRQADWRPPLQSPDLEREGGF
jgi:hypothetical protein